MLKKFGMIVSVVALLTLALVGCKNGMLGEDEATVNGEREAGGRTAKVTITNFADNGNGATRSVVGGPLRTITPEAINLANDAGNYIFVATGTNNRVSMDPKIVPVDGASGRVDLSGLNPGTWTITITAYSRDKLNAVGGVDLADVTQVQAQKNTCAVLQGTGYVDLRNSNSDVKITLTPDGIGTEGGVNVDFTLHTDDQQEISNKTYNVHIALYDGSSLVGNNEDVSVAARASVNINYTNATVDVGRYVLKVTISDPATGLGPWIWSDIIYVEGNRLTESTVLLPKLIGEAPTQPQNFAVYYNTDTVDGNTGNYTATFAWDRKSYNEQGFELQIYDITDKYNYTGGQMQYDSINFTDAENLWQGTALDRNGDKDSKGLKTKDTIGTDVTYPKYAGGNLMAASTYVDYKLETGHIYVFRLRAENVEGKSPWVYFSSPVIDPASKNTHPANATLRKFEEKIVSVYTVTYDLQNSFILAAENDTLPDAAINTTVEPVVYRPATPYDILYLPKGNYLLFKTGATGNADAVNPNYVSGWTGWIDAYNSATQFNDVQATYDKWSNLRLTTVGGASGKSAMLEIISSGTFSKLLDSGEKVLLKLQQNIAPVTWQDAEKITSYTNDVSRTTDGFGKINTVFALNIDTNNGNATRYLYFTVGQDIGAGNIEAGKLKTDTDLEVTISKVVFTLEDSKGEVCSGLGNPVGYVDLNGLGSGNYTLRIVATNTHGYDFTYQIPIIVKYDTDTI